MNVNATRVLLHHRISPLSMHDLDYSVLVAVVDAGVLALHAFKSAVYALPRPFQVSRAPVILAGTCAGGALLNCPVSGTRMMGQKQKDAHQRRRPIETQPYSPSHAVASADSLLMP